MKRDTSARVCVIGAGVSGITAGKNLLQAGIRNLVIYEREGQLGGNWVYSPHGGHSSVYESTHLISSKKWSQFEDYPMPDDYPDYPSHRLMLAYFQNYARHFGVESYIQFNTEVINAERMPDETWQITLGNGSVESFDYLLVANGHHWNPRMPDYPGTFTGQFLHSHDFKTAEPFRAQRVLVIGGGNSAADISSDISRVASFTGQSMRRGYYITPKFLMGQPIDVVNARLSWLPFWVRERLERLALYFIVGDFASYGLERPKHNLLSQHTTTSDELLSAIRHGEIHPRRDVSHFNGRTVHFVDGTAEDYDVVIACTGYVITHPFFSKSFVDYSDGDVPLYLRTFHPDYPSLFFVGLVQPLGCIWPLSDLHAQLAAQFIIGRYNPPSDIRQAISDEILQRRKAFYASARHTIEVDFHAHVKELKAALKTAK